MLFSPSYSHHRSPLLHCPSALRGSWIDVVKLREHYGAAQEKKSLRISSCLATSLKPWKAQEFIFLHWANSATPLERGAMVAVCFRIHGTSCPSRTHVAMVIVPHICMYCCEASYLTHVTS